MATRREARAWVSLCPLNPITIWNWAFPANRVNGTTPGNHLWSAGVFDAALHLGPSFEAKGEYILTRYGSDDLGTHSQEGWWVQAGYKLAGLDLELPVINNLEIVGRYDALHDVYDPNNNDFDFKTQRYTVGYVYYFTNTLLFEGDYEFVNSNDPSQADQLIFQLSLGF